MSYILDALKKSDRERKRGDVPNLQTVHIPINMETQSPWLLYGFISFLLLSLAFVIGMMISGKDDAVVSTVSSNVDNALLSEPNLAPVSEIEKNQGPVVKRKVKTKADKVAVKKVQAKTAQPDKVLPEIKPQRVVQAATEPVKQQLDLMNIPYLNELPDYQQQSVPQMNFAGHVYSSSPKSRSVIINDVAMSEGDTIVQGINVIEITPSGVVFSLHDILFRVDILQDWSFE